MKTLRSPAKPLATLTGIASVACAAAAVTVGVRAEGESPKAEIEKLIADRHEDAASARILALAGQEVDAWALAWAQREFAHMAALDGTLAERRTEWRAAYRTRPGEAFAAGMAAQVLFASGETDEAVGVLRAFVERADRSESALRLVAATLEWFGLYGEALEVYAELLRGDPGNPTYLGAPDGWMAVIEDRGGRWDRLVERLRADGANPFLHTLAGDYARELREYAAAVLHYRAAVARGGGVYAKLRLAEALKAVGGLQEAMTLYREVAGEGENVYISAADRSRDEALRRLGELESAEEADFSEGAWIKLGEDVVGHGLELVERIDSATAVVNVGGRTCRKTDGARGGYYFRLRVNDRFLFETEKPVIVEVDYFDDATGMGKCTVSYDSVDPGGSWMPIRNGRDTERRCFYRGKTKQWKTTTFRLPGARFGNRMEDYTDMRIRSFGDTRTGGDLCVSEIRLRVDDAYEPAERPTYKGETRTIALADLPDLKLLPYNVEDCRLTASPKGEVQSSKFKVQSSKFKVQSSKFKVQSSKFKVQSPHPQSPITNHPFLRLDYYFPHKPTGDYAWVEIVVDQPLPTPPRSIGIRMDPRGSACEAGFRIVDAEGETFQMKITYQMRGYGWTLVKRAPTFLGASWGNRADSVIDYPARLHSILVDTGRKGRDSVYLRDIVIDE